MTWIEALILGFVQGFTEFLPVSSSGHLELGQSILNAGIHKSLEFTIAVHGATVLSTIIIFRKEIGPMIKNFFTFQKTEDTAFVWKLLISMIPIGIIGYFFHEQIKSFFTGNVKLVGGMLIITSLLLALTKIATVSGKPISYLSALIMGVAQVFAVFPGISRSGATIATGLFFGNRRDEVTRFSFLMVIIPILGANFIGLFNTDFSQSTQISGFSLTIGFLAAFVSGLIACKWMIQIVKRGNLYYFAIYCFLIGSLAIIFG